MSCRIIRPAIRLLQATLSAYLLLSATGCSVTGPISTPASSLPVTSATTKVASGPVLGYLWDAVAGGLRPISGLPGAAREGAALYNDGTFSAATACSQKSYALLTAKTGTVSFTTLPSGEPAQIAAKLSAKQQIVLSPSCSSALLYAPDTSTATLILSLPSAPQAKSIALPAQGTLLGAAVADSGSILIASAQADGSAVIQSIVSGTTSPASIGVLSRYGGMSFLPQTDQALFADAARNTLLLASQITGNIALAQIAGPADGISQPVAVASSADGRTAVVAGSAIVRIDLSGQTASLKIACQCSPSELAPLSGNLIFRLNEPGSGTVWTFDGDSPASRIVFLPTEQLTSTVGAAQ
jgi:hypothetical protein